LAMFYQRPRAFSLKTRLPTSSQLLRSSCIVA
jgi:hypothetical protein